MASVLSGIWDASQNHSFMNSSKPSGGGKHYILPLSIWNRNYCNIRQFTKVEFDFNAAISSVAPCNATTTLGVLCASRLPWPNLPKAPHTTGHKYKLKCYRNHPLQDPNFNISNVSMSRYSRASPSLNILSQPISPDGLHPMSWPANDPQQLLCGAHHRP